MPESIATRVMEVIAKTQRIDVATVTLEKSFADLNIDSLDGLRIVFELEEAFGIVIPDDQAKAYSTVALAIEGITLLVEQKLAAESAKA